jgi:outer membrane protein assembly factor BamC
MSDSLHPTQGQAVTLSFRGSIDMVQLRIFAVLALVALGGCSKIVPRLDEVIPDNRVEYRKSRTLPDLEVPPDLTTDAIKDRMAIPEGGDTATYSTYQERAADRKRQQELERTANEAVRVLDNEHVLAVQGATSQIWPQLVELMNGLGYELDLNDEELGVIETVWQENEAELHREKFKIFAEPGEEAGTTVLYISNRAEELVQRDGEMTWTPKARDAEREKLLVQRVQEKLGVGGAAPAADVATRESVAALEAEQDAGVPAAQDEDLMADTDPGALNGRAALVSAGGGKVYLSVREDFSAAWRSTGLALERAGFDVDRAEKDRGIYFVRVPVREGETEERGMLSKLKFWGDDDLHDLQLNLTGVGAKTEVVVLDREGRWETGKVSRRVLDRLNREINRLER